jgi:hypothetical protein
MNLLAKPELTKKRIVAAFTIAVIADILEFPIVAAENLSLGALLLPAEAADVFLDFIVMVAMTKVLGFHWLFLPSFLVEAVPDLSLFPTWVGCVAYVVWQRRKEPPPSRLSGPDAIDVAAAPAAATSLPPALPPAAAPSPPLLAAETAVEQRLRSLNELREKNLVTPNEYEAKRRQILEDL